MTSSSVHKKGMKIGPYRLVSLLGAGAGGEVWAAIGRDNAPAALKFFKGGTPLDIVQREFDTGRRLDYGHIIRPRSLEIIDNEAIIALPYCEGRSIDNAAGFFTEKNAWKLLLDIGSALAFMHADGLCHGDVKPSNILREGENFFLSDFGSCFSPGGQSAPGDLSSYQYCAPETSRSEKSDIWSLGATVFYLVMGSMVFNGFGGKKQKRDSDIPIMRKSMPGLSALVSRCLSFEAAARPSAQEICREAKQAMNGCIINTRPVKRIIHSLKQEDEFGVFWPEEMKDAL